MSNSRKIRTGVYVTKDRQKGSVDHGNGFMTGHSYLPYLPQQVLSFLSPSGPRTSCDLRPSNSKMQ